MKIACCDDNRTDLELLVSYCKCYNENFQIYTYTAAKDMLDSYSSVLFDIVFLGIETVHSNSFEVAVQLSHESKPPIVIFTAQTRQHAVDGYGLALQYLLKPVSYERFQQALQLAIEKKTPAKISVTANRKTEILAVSDISYIEVVRHHVIFHMLERQDVCMNSSFGVVLNQLPNDCFMQTHKSYCVNLHHVTRIERDILILTDGTKIPVGRSYSVKLKECLVEFLSRGY